MGGCGSTRWNGYAQKYTVEHCLILDANRWMREDIFREGIRQFGEWRWLDSITGERTSTLCYEIDMTSLAHSWIQLFYTIIQTGETVNYKIRLATTSPHFGGLRWWFRCPLVVNGIPCYRRVGKIYLPPGARYYGCRRCYNLTYRSCQEADKRVSWLRNNPEALLEIVHNSESTDPAKLFLAMKALRNGFA